MNLITVEKVNKQYSERILLDGVNLLVNSGDRIGLIGRNGSGKTTLLRMLAGEELPDAGKVTIWGKVRVRFLSQNPHFEAGQTVLGALYESDSADMQLLQSYMAASVLAEQSPNDAKLQEALETVTWQMDAENGWSLEAKAKTILSKLGVLTLGRRLRH